MAFAIIASLTLPLNPPPWVGDFGRYAPGEEMGVTTLQHYRGVMDVTGVTSVTGVTPAFPFTFSFTEYLCLLVTALQHYKHYSITGV